MTLAERVKLARTKRGLTQRELAERCDPKLSAGYISMLETPAGQANAIAKPGLPGLQRIASVLEVPEGWLILGAGDEPAWPAEPAPTVDHAGEPAA